MIESKYKIKDESETNKVKTINFEYNKSVSRTENLEGVVKKEFNFGIFFPYKDDNGTLKGFTNLGNDINSRWNIGMTDNYNLLVSTWMHEICHNWYPEDHEINIRIRTRTGGYG